MTTDLRQALRSRKCSRVRKNSINSRLITCHRASSPEVTSSCYKEVLSLPDISCKPACLDVLVEQKLEYSLLETEKQLEPKAKEESTVISSTTDLDNIIDVLDLYLTSTDSHTDITTNTVNDEEQVQPEVSHSEPAATSLTTTSIPTIDGIIETITQNDTVYATTQPLEGGFYFASLNLSVTKELNAVEYIPVT